jgi:hypothetical protein
MRWKLMGDGGGISGLVHRRGVPGKGWLVWLLSDQVLYNAKRT